MAIQIKGDGTIIAPALSLTSAGVLNATGIQAPTLTTTGQIKTANPFISYYANAAQSVAATTSTTNILFGGQLHDVGGGFNAATGVYKPTVPGLYMVMGTVAFNAAASSTVFSGVMKNGVEHCRGPRMAGTGSNMACTFQGLIYMNGTTDYINIYQYSATALTVNSGIGITWLQAVMIKSA